jgi:non-specific protein-tyrosine kinase
VLASRRLEHVLSLVRAQADLVLVDTPPAAVLADAALLAPRLDGVLLVVSAGRTKRDLAKRAKEQLERTGSNVLGVVLINVRESGKLYQY